MISEGRLISAICTNSDAAFVLRNTDIDDLFGDTHKDIWEKVKTHYYKYRSTPNVSLLKEWFPTFEVDQIDAPTAYYLEELRNYKVTRKLESVAARIEKYIGQGEPPDKILRGLQKVMSDMTRMSSGTKDLDITDSRKALKHYEQVAERVSLMGGAVGIQTGFKSIDTAYTTGQAPGHFICIIGWPGHKKTFFGAELAIRVWEQGFKPMIVSLEMTPENMRDRVYTMMGNGTWRMSAFNKASFDMEQFRSWSESTLDEKQDFIITSAEGVSDMTPAAIQAKIDQYKPDWVLIDYLQLLQDNKRSAQDTARVMNISKELKMLAISNSIPVVAVISATSNDKEDRNHPPVLSQVAWSKSIEYDADMALAVHTYKDDTETQSITEVVKRKNRHGDDFAFYMDLDPETGVLTESWEAPSWLDA